MGFFASRWVEKHGADTEKAALSTPMPVVQSKPKWYSRKKEPESPRGGTATSSKQKQNNNLHLDTRISSSNGNPSYPSPYSTLPSSSKAGPSGSSTALNNGYGTVRKATSSNPTPTSPKQRSATDTVTVTLAQKLEELANANADGLLSDDEYRVLRQNLFERFGSVAAQIPVEQSPINMPSPSTRQNANANQDRATGSSALPQGDSNFTVSNSRRSIRSTASRGSSVQTAITSLIRRATGRSTPRTSFNGSGNDAESTYSRGSRNSSVFYRGTLPRTLVHKASAGSIQTSPSIMGGNSAFDSRSIASRRTNRSGVDNATIMSRTTSRSRPPSSYHRRHAPSEGGSDEIGAEWTAAELRAEILSIEEESKRVMDMFNGLEMTMMMKYRPATAGRSASESIGAIPTEWKPLPDIKRVQSQEKSSSRLSMSSRSFSSLQRKGSLSFLRRSQALPPLPPLPTAAASTSTSMSMSLSPGLRGSTSSPSSLHPMVGASQSQSNRSSPNLSLDKSSSHGKLSRSRSGYMGTNHGKEGGAAAIAVAAAVAGNAAGRDDDRDPEQAALETGLDDIRRKRATVVSRYDKRLEYLRARLRSAELHERLLK